MPNGTTVNRAADEVPTAMDQVQVLSAVCKKLNHDIEALANQTSMRESVLAQLNSNQHGYDEQFRQFNTDMQIKMSKTDTILQKLQSDVDQMSHGLRETLNSQQETSRTNVQTLPRIETRGTMSTFIACDCSRFGRYRR